MVERRGSLEARLSVVEALTEESRVTWVMLRSRQSHAKVKALLAELAKLGLIEAGGDGPATYRLTPRGRMVLEAWLSLKRMLEMKQDGKLQG